MLKQVETASKIQLGSTKRIRGNILSMVACATQALNDWDQSREGERNKSEWIQSVQKKVREAEGKLRAAENRAVVAEQALQELQAVQTHTQITSTEAAQQTPQTSHVSHSGSKRKAEDNENEANIIGTKKLRESAPEKQLGEHSNESLLSAGMLPCSFCLGHTSQKLN